MGVAGPPGDIWMVPPYDGRPWRVRLVRRGRTSPPQGARHDGNPSSPGRGTDGERPQRGPEAVRAARERPLGDGGAPRPGGRGRAFLSHDLLGPSVVDVPITFCVPCRFQQKAIQDADAILKEFGRRLASVRLVTGDDGVYDVAVDGQVG